MDSISGKLYGANLFIDSVINRDVAGVNHTYIIVKAKEEKINLLVTVMQDPNSNEEGMLFKSAVAIDQFGTIHRLTNDPYYYKLMIYVSQIKY